MVIPQDLRIRIKTMAERERALSGYKVSEADVARKALSIGLSELETST